MVAQENQVVRRGRPAGVVTTALSKLSESATRKLLRSIVDAVTPAIEETVIARVKHIGVLEKEHAVTPIKESNVPVERRKSSRLSQAEKLLIPLLSGKIVSLTSLNKQLSKTIQMYRLSAYLWDLKQIGAEIVRHKSGRKIIGLQLKNIKQMQKYMEEHNELAA